MTEEKREKTVPGRVKTPFPVAAACGNVPTIGPVCVGGLLTCLDAYLIGSILARR